MRKFKLNDIVKLNIDSDYNVSTSCDKTSWNPNFCTGKIVSLYENTNHIRVDWKNDTRNGYSSIDLDYISNKEIFNYII